MKKFILAAVSAAAAAAVALGLVYGLSVALMPEYNPAAGYEYSQEKVKGKAVIASAAQEDNTIFLFGSSELSTTMIASHPANFFTENDMDFDLCTVGRGSSQSIIHAMILAGNADSLRGKKIVFLISPQHFVPDGIEPDMFVANFSQQQFLSAMNSSLPEKYKTYLAQRTIDCFESYRQEFGDPGFDSSEMLANQIVSNSVARIPLKPYYALEDYLLTVRDNITAGRLFKNTEGTAGASTEDFDWDSYRDEMIQLGASESDNNDFGILNDYYNTNIGKKLGRNENKDADLSYSQSIEYDDLQCLIDLCKELDIDALFVHTPLNGKWSDYCGFTTEKRQEYYNNVRALLEENGCNYLDLTEKEYDPYYLCDVMHIGWVGWVDINEAIYDFYYTVQ